MATGLDSREDGRRFLELASRWLVSLPHDLRILFEAKDDPNLDRAAREIAAAAIICALTPDAAGEGEFSAFADDAILLHDALVRIVTLGGEGAADFQTRFAEYFDGLDADLAICRNLLGDDYAWLVANKLDALGRLTYKQKKLALYLDDDEAVEQLYDDGLAFGTNYPIDEEKIEMRLRKPETLIEALRRKAVTESKKQA